MSDGEPAAPIEATILAGMGVLSRSPLHVFASR